MVKKTVRFGEQAAVPAIGLGFLVYGRTCGAASAGSGCTAGGHRPWTDGDRYGGNVRRRRGGGSGGRAIRGLRDRVVLVSKVYPGMPAKRRCTAPVKTACAGCRPTIWTCISCTGAGISRCRRRLRRWRSWWPRARSAAGASLIWTPRICRRCGGRRMASTVQPTGALPSRIAGH